MNVSPRRSTIAYLASSGLSASEIARRLQMPSRTVQRLVKQYREEGNIEPRKRTGRPRTKNTPRIRKIIKKGVVRNDGVSLNKIAKDLGVSRRTVQVIVERDLHLRSYRIYRGHTLTEAAMKNRLEKAKALLNHIRQGRLS
ncbi:hypothetical protein TELCIR_20996, partial [Teladorsagia circumcincta]